MLAETLEEATYPDSRDIEQLVLPILSNKFILQQSFQSSFRISKSKSASLYPAAGKRSSGQSAESLF
jgi:hypothetical protein